MIRYCVVVVMNICLLFGCQGRTISEMVGVPHMSPMGSDLHNNDRKLFSGLYFNNPKLIQKNYSLWRDSQSALFKDSRAINIGDILTVNIQINDNATFDNKTGRSRNSSLGKELLGGFSFLGIQSNKMNANVKYDSNSSLSGNGSISRAEKLELRIAAIVTEILDNGNLIISGSQEVRVNDEIRILNVTGLVRPQDVDAHNSISYYKIAEARISYGGKGHAIELQKAPIGQQLMDKFSPI
ncbi:MAG: flagellar basal body L-ring protein [Candidatus Liberibacter europaeus]|uniref:Flagellar L-ring protein n=1 Tax=Candidatus Liberibacter europaeus TaxID=744859 RepID=A0A2T4VYI6_9HYPH|nr:flagellar basal body L-ring protein [Candidatus Liberibacter europaeus]PTL86833.1 MAG: flagellar basal body L-ring protein [Candidatus Liberibacter europaeus]